MYALLSHLTLALAGLCLAWAEWPYLPEMPLILAIYLMLVALAWRLNRRFLLPNWAANVLGLLIAGGGTAWVAIRLRDPSAWAREVDLSGALIPYLGPILMALLVVRLYRPLRLDDFWLLQGLGLLEVALGCVLATDHYFGILLLAYLACGLCALAAHERETQARACQAPLPDSGGWLGFAARWAPAVAALAWPLFLVTPRLDIPEWQPLTRFGIREGTTETTRVGFNAEMNLNHASTLEIDDSVAFIVTVTDERGRRRSLPGDQLWRGSVLDRYTDGKWSSSLSYPGSQPYFQLYNLGPLSPDVELRRIQFEVPGRLGHLFLAEPLLLGPKPGEMGVQALDRPGGAPALIPMFVEAGGTAVSLGYLVRPDYVYTQTVVLRPDQPRIRLTRMGDDHLRQMVNQRISGMETYTVDLLRRLAVRDATLKPVIAALDQPRPRGWTLPTDQWELVAQRLNDHLARSGEFTYSLNNLRTEPALDPVVDFLTNVRAGSCERYAAALTLMLRSVAIPARIVKGFRGVDPRGEGFYEIRQSQAHAWVEVVVPTTDREAFEWMSLDPTPAAEAPASWANWWQQQQRSGEMLWQNLLIGYNARNQAHLLEDLLEGRLLGRLALLGGVVALALLAVWLWRRRVAAARRRGPAGLFGRLQEMVTRLGIFASAQQTPRELAEAATVKLEQNPALARLADLPGRVTDLLYRCRWGGETASPDEARRLSDRLDDLERALAAR